MVWLQWLASLPWHHCEKSSQSPIQKKKKYSPPHTSELQQTAYLEKWITNRKFFFFSLFFLLHIFSGWLERLWIPSRREHAHKSLGFFFLLSFTFTFTLSLSQFSSIQLGYVQFSSAFAWFLFSFSLPVFFYLSSSVLVFSNWFVRLFTCFLFCCCIFCFFSP